LAQGVIALLVAVLVRVRLVAHLLFLVSPQMAVVVARMEAVALGQAELQVVARLTILAVLAVAACCLVDAAPVVAAA
jgi:hypothetical protein